MSALGPTTVQICPQACYLQVVSFSQIAHGSFISKDLIYLYVSACLCMCAGTSGTQKRVLEVPAAGITSSCGPPDVYVGNQSPVL